jgi:hypothetical protein
VILCRFDDASQLDDLCIVLSGVTLKSKDATIYLNEQGLLARLLAFPPDVSYGGLLFSFVKWLSIDIPEVQAKTIELIASGNLLNAQFGLKIGLRLELQESISSPSLVMANLVTPGLGKVAYLTLKILFRIPDIWPEILGVVYQNLQNWNFKAASTGLRLLKRHFEATAQIIQEVGIGPLVECIVGRERKVKLRAFRLLCWFDELAPIDDIGVLDALLGLVDEAECADDAVRMIMGLSQRCYARGMATEFAAALADVEDELCDLEMSSNDLVADMARQLIRAVSEV